MVIERFRASHVFAEDIVYDCILDRCWLDLGANMHQKEAPKGFKTEFNNNITMIEKLFALRGTRRGDLKAERLRGSELGTFS